MTYGTLLLHLDDTPATERRTRLAARFARQLDAHLVGLANAGAAPLEVGLGQGVLPKEQIDVALLAPLRAAQVRARHFEERVRGTGLQRFHALVDGRDDAQALSQHGLHCDLLLLGRPEPDDRHRRTQFEHVLVQSAPPVLVLPALPENPAPPGQHVLVAWSETRESARAVAAALPLLRRARSVHLVRVDAPAPAGIEGAAGALEDVRQWLERAGAHAEVMHCVTREDPGRTLLQLADEQGADLLVMGLWGHGRVAEHLFGGVTRTLLAQATIPVLATH